MPMKLRVWAEFVTPLEMMEPRVVRLLKKYDVSPLVAFPPDGMNESYARMMSAHEAEGLETGLWPLLEDEKGYWASERNAKDFSETVLRLLDWADERGFHLPWIAVDLEPPHEQMQRFMNASGVSLLRAAWDIYNENRNPGRFKAASKRYRDLLRAMHQRNTRAVAPVPHPLWGDVMANTTHLQDLMETPVTPVRWDVLSFMVYTSTFASMTRGFASRADSLWFLYRLCGDMKEKLWERAGVSLGCTGKGKISKEIFEKPSDMAPDVAAAKAALMEDISIFNLEGILRSPRPEEWFEMFHSVEPRIPDHSLKAELALRAILTAAQWL